MKEVIIFMDASKKTALYDKHVEYGGQIIDFSGWQLPVQYEGLVEEHEAVRNAAGAFDVSHMGEVSVKGEQSLEFIQNLVTNDISVLEDKQILYCMMCYEDGGVVDDLLVYKFAEKEYFLVINAGNITKDYNWIIESSKAYDVQIEDKSGEFAEVALQGPKAQEILQKLTSYDLADLKFFYCEREVDIAGIKCMISRTGYTGEDGFEIYMGNDDAKTVWDKLFEVGKDMGLKPAGLGARDTLRFEAALPLYGHEISQDITPLEAGLGYFVKLGKENFTGKDALVKQKEEGLKRKTIGFELLGKGIPRAEYDVEVDGRKIGFVTTGYKSPSLGKCIGIAIVETEFGSIGTEIDIKIRNKTSKAKVISRKFFDKKYKK
jgi:aminomethyltransferase